MTAPQVRASHAAGPTRVCADGGHILTGGSDGKVCLFTCKRWPNSAPVWVADGCHTTTITCLTLCDALGVAFSGGRDGSVVMHQHTNTAAPQRRTVCRVTGEINCIFFDRERMRVFIAGDSVRYVSLKPGAVAVMTIPLPAPGPIFAIALSPCGEVLAMASAAGSVSVVSIANDTKPGQTQTQTQTQNDAEPTATTATTVPAAQAKIRNLRFIVAKVLSATRRKDLDFAAFRMSWALSQSGDLLLAVPTPDGIRILKLTPGSSDVDTASTRPHQLTSVGSVHLEGLVDPFAVHLFPSSKHKLAVVAAASTPGAAKVFVAKVDDAKWRADIHAIYSADGGATATQDAATDHAASTLDAIVDLEVDVANGNICYAMKSGKVGLVRAATPGVVTATKKLQVAAAAAAVAATVPSAAPPAADVPAAPKAPLQLAGLPKAPSASKVAIEINTRIEKKTAASQDEEEDEEGEDEEEEVVSDDGSNSSNSKDDESDVTSSSDDDNAARRKTSRNHRIANAPPENIPEVVTDLIDAHPAFVAEDGVRRHGMDEALRSHRHGFKKQQKHEDAKKPRGTTFAVPKFIDEEAEESEAGSNSSDAGDDDRLDEDLHDGGIPVGEEEEEEGLAGDVADDDDELPSRGRRSRERHRAGGATSGLRVLEPEPLYTVQPGMTAPGNDGARYLAFNNIGCIRVGAEGDLTCFFHDISRPAVRLTEKSEPVLGALGLFGAAIIYRPDDVDGCYTLFYRIFQGLGTQPSWKLALLKDEEPLCVAVGAMRIAVATTFYLRIFTPSGMEVAVLSQAAHVVGLAALSSARHLAQADPTVDPLAVAVFSGGEVVVRVVNMAQRGKDMLSPTPIPLGTSPQTGLRYPLQWLGFSEDGPLCAADTRGIVWQLTPDFGTSWVPLHDPRHAACLTKNVWIYGICDKHIYGYLLQGEEVYPPAVPAAQLPQEHCALCCPLLTACGPKAMLHRDQAVRHNLQAAHARSLASTYTEGLAKLDAKCDQRLFEAFVSAVKEQDLARAFDYASLFELRDTLEKACNFTNGANMTFLTNKLQVLLQLRRAKKMARQCTLPLEGDLSDRDRDAIIKKLLVALDTCQKTIATLEGKVSTVLATAAAAAAATASVSVAAGNAPYVTPTKAREDATDDIGGHAAAGGASATRAKRISFATEERQEAPASPPAAPPASAAAFLPREHAVAKSLLLPAGSTLLAPRPLVAASRPLTAAAPLETATPAPVVAVAKPTAPFGKKAMPVTAALLSKPQPVAAVPVAVVEGAAAPASTSAAAHLAHSPPGAAPSSAIVSQQPLLLAKPAKPQPAPHFHAVAATPGAHPTAPADADGRAPVFHDLPIDPFLSQGQDGASVLLQGRRISMDVGHADYDVDASQVLARSASFGDALRKRYRSEEEDSGDEAPDSAPRVPLFNIAR